jgi:hypothetical protein
MRKFVPIILCDFCDNAVHGLTYELKTALQFMEFAKNEGWNIQYINNTRYDYCPECSK